MIPRYGYAYLMWYKFEAFGRFKEYRLEVENQTSRKIKALRSDRGGEYLSGEFIDYLKENGILSQWTLPQMPKLNGVAERRNRTLLDMVRSMMSFTELSPFFWCYALETTAELLNIAPSKTVPQTPYEIWHGKPTSYKYLRVWGSYAYVKRLVGDKLDSRSSLCSRRDEVLIEESSEEPQHGSTILFEPLVHTDGVSVLHRSTRESRVPERWQMDVETAFLNGFVEERSIWISPKVSPLLEKNRNFVISKGHIKAWLSTQFSVKGMGEASYILEIKIYRDRSRRMLGLTQSSYIEKVLKRFKMDNSKRGLLPMRHGIKLSKKQSPKTNEELKKMSDIPYTSVVGSIL
ncbi:UNVERIFIED_CONTAM: hypothetical protein Sradi_7196500, partial [Sesamum radiatum]